MPFDFKKYDAKCANLDGDALQLEWEHYTRLISGAATSTAVSGMAVPFTFGVSSIGIGFAAPAIHNARKKREIIERHLHRVGRSPRTRKRDVVGAGAVSGAVGVATLGLAPIGADAICNTAAEHGIASIVENEFAVKIATHLVLDAGAVAAEESHMNSRKEQEAWRAYSQSSKHGEVSSFEQPVMSYNNWQDATPRSKPMSYDSSTWQQQTSMESTVMYFPPPPSRADLKAESVCHSRNSCSTPSIDAQKLSPRLSQPQSSGHVIWGTSTAISTPLTAGQGYPVQLSSQSADCFVRPASEIRSTTSPTVQGTSPLPSPVQSHYMHVQQHQTQLYEPEKHTVGSFNGRPDCGMSQNFQPRHGIAQPSSPYFTAPIPPPPPPYTPTIPGNPGYQSTWSQPYDPSQYAKRQSQGFHGPAEIVHPLYSTSHRMDDKRPVTLYSSTEIYGAPHQQVPYFPPPPNAY